MNIGSHVLKLFATAKTAQRPQDAAAEIARIASSPGETSASTVGKDRATKWTISTRTVSGVTLNDPAALARMAERNRVTDALMSGALSPLDKQFVHDHGESFDYAQQEGLHQIGKFGSFTSDARPIGYADFQSRDVAMMNAFHRAMRLAGNGTMTAALTSGVELDGDPLGGQLAETRERMTRNVEYLAAQFNFTDTTESMVRLGEDGRYAFTGFEVTHERFGKLLSVDARGVMTFYDQDGTAYSKKAYDEVRPDGLIPELANDIIRTERRIADTQERIARTDDPKALAMYDLRISGLQRLL